MLVKSLNKFNMRFVSKQEIHFNQEMEKTAVTLEATLFSRLLQTMMKNITWEKKKKKY